MKGQTFVIVHDQDILLSLQKKGAFNCFYPHFTWLFVGDKPTDKLNYENLLNFSEFNLKEDYFNASGNVIVCRDLPNNIEQHKNLLVFTAWYAIVKNKLISEDVDYVNLFEYDVEPPENILPILQKEFVKNDADIVGYNPLPITHWEFLGELKWSHGFRKAIIKHKKKDFVFSLMRLMLYTKGTIDNWNTTTNVSFRKSFLEYLVNYLEPCIEDLSKDTLAGHGLERYITWFAIENKLRVKTAPFVLKHYQANSHKTQPHESIFKA